MAAKRTFDRLVFDLRVFDARRAVFDGGFDPTVFDAAAVYGTTIRIVAALPAITGSVTAVYASETERPIIGGVAARYQEGLPATGGVTQRYQEGRPVSIAHEAVFEDAVGLNVAAEAGWRDSEAIAVSAHPRWQDALAKATESSIRFQDTLQLEHDRWVRFRDALALEVPSTTSRFQTAIDLYLATAIRYQEARPLALFETLVLVGEGLPLSAAVLVRFQDATALPVGEWVDGGNNGTDPPDPPVETVIVPIRRIYTVINSASLRRVDGDVLIPNLSMSLSIDVDSWTWGFTARVPGAALDDLQPSAGVPVELEARINGVAYRAIVEGISRDRVFGRSDLTVTGRGLAAVLDAPYSPVMTFGNAADRSVQQLANDVLTVNGVPLGWDIDSGWAPEDWLVPAGVWSHQGSYMSALNAIAADAGAYVQPHRTDKALSVLLRYPAKPWEWNEVSPDFELPAAVVQKEGTVWTDKPNYNRVFVRGMKSGVLGQVTRAGTAGDIEAPMVTAQLATNAIGARQRALPVLADTGRQAAVSLRLPVLPETGIIPPGKFVRYVDAGVPRIGLVRSVAAETARADDRLTVWQTIGVETHV